MNPAQPIQPLTTRREINVVEPVSPALEHVKTVLFRPFNLGKWFIIGFCAWLAQLGETGGSSPGGHFNYNNQSHSAGSDIRHGLEQARNYLFDNLNWIIPLAAVLIVVGFGFWLLFLWLNSRGKFMFLHCVALNRAEVTAPWNQFGCQGDSLFWFRLVLGLAGMILTLPLLAIIAFLVLRMIYRDAVDPAGIMTAVGLGLIFFVLAVAFAIVRKFTVDFIVPIMFLRRSNCLAAWREFGRLLSGHLGVFVLYLLFQIVLGIAIGALVVMAVLVTCCIAGCLMALPYLGTVLLLPVFVFKRAYSLFFLAQFGPEYNAYPPPPPAPAPPSPLPMPGIPPVA